MLTDKQVSRFSSGRTGLKARISFQGEAEKYAWIDQCQFRLNLILQGCSEIVLRSARTGGHSRRTIIYPMEIADLIHKIRTGHSNLIPDDLAEDCGTIADLMSGWERNAMLKIFSYEGHSRRIQLCNHPSRARPSKCIIISLPRTRRFTRFLGFG
jgi:hypothetical protein